MPDSVNALIRPFIDGSCPEMSQIVFSEFSVGGNTYSNDDVHNIFNGIRESGGNYCGKIVMTISAGCEKTGLQDF